MLHLQFDSVLRKHSKWNLKFLIFRWTEHCREVAYNRWPNNVKHPYDDSTIQYDDGPNEFYTEADDTEHRISRYYVDKSRPKYEDYTMPHAIWTREEMDNIQITHKEPERKVDKLALFIVKVARLWNWLSLSYLGSAKYSNFPAIWCCGDRLFWSQWRVFPVWCSEWYDTWIHSVDCNGIVVGLRHCSLRRRMKECIYWSVLSIFIMADEMICFYRHWYKLRKRLGQRWSWYVEPNNLFHDDL